MKQITVVVLLLLIAFSVTSDARKRQNNIVGGTTATQNQFPFMVYLTIGQFVCDGFLLTPSHVGTAAHCFEPTDTPAGITAQAGTNDISIATNGQTRGASAFQVHPLFDTTLLTHDAAIITLSAPFDIDGVTTRLVPMATSIPSVGTTAFVPGWGDTQTGGPSSDQLLFVDLALTDLTTCNTTFDGDIVEGLQICAGGVPGKDTCQGDSGGPMIVTSNIANPTDAQVIALVSYGKPNCAVAKPGVYSNVPGFAAAFFQAVIDGSVIPSSPAVVASSHSAQSQEPQRTPSKTGSKPGEPEGAAAIACRNTCYSNFITCKRNTGRLRYCRRQRRTCVGTCGVI